MFLPIRRDSDEDVVFDMREKALFRLDTKVCCVVYALLGKDWMRHVFGMLFNACFSQRLPVLMTFFFCN